MKSVWEALSIVRKFNLHTMKGSNNINCVMSATRALSTGNREFGPPNSEWMSGGFLRVLVRVSPVHLTDR